MYELEMFWSNFLGLLKTIKIIDVIDILCVAYVVYYVIKLVRETRAIQLIKGLFALLVIYLIASQLEMITVTFIMRNILQVGIFVLAVIFQPELRRALEKVGRTSIKGIPFFGGAVENGEEQNRIWENSLKEIVRSCSYLSDNKIGALIVIEREIKLGDIIRTGTVLNAEVTLELVSNVFFPKSPLHDGAMIIRNGRLYAAGCFLPLSDNNDISRQLGTRHRAALGMSEQSDAIVIIVSEETGVVSSALDGQLKRNLSVESLRKLLSDEILVNPEVPVKKAPFWRVKK